ncbi:MAG: hypothetical protein Q4D04_13540 [Clostridia bacterium]|nr:hypothetical protein [Clostridia bacterium]
MIRRMVAAALGKRGVVRDDWGEQIEQWTDEPSPVDIAISASAGGIESANNVLSINSTHTGVTRDERPQPGDRITAEGRAYKVDYAMDGRIYRQLFLSACEDV